MNQIVSIHQAIYIPLFDETLDKYIDKSPYKPYERNCIRYECRCKAGTSFISTSQFKQHIKSKTHQEFIRNYDKYYKEVDEASVTIKNLKIENEMLHRKIQKISRDQLSSASEIKKYQSTIHHLLQCIQEDNDDKIFYDCNSDI